MWFLKCKKWIIILVNYIEFHEYTSALSTYKTRGSGGDSQNTYEDDHRDCWKTPLKVTSMGVAPANFTP